MKVILQWKSGDVTSVDMPAMTAGTVVKFLNAGGKAFLWDGIYYVGRFIKYAHVRVEP